MGFDEFSRFPCGGLHDVFIVLDFLCPLYLLPGFLMTPEVSIAVLLGPSIWLYIFIDGCSLNGKRCLCLDDLYSEHFIVRMNNELVYYEIRMIRGIIATIQYIFQGSYCGAFKIFSTFFVLELFHYWQTFCNISSNASLSFSSNLLLVCRQNLEVL